MSGGHPLTRVDPGQPRIALSESLLVWFGAWFVGYLVVGAVVAGAINDDGATPTWAVAVSAVALWVPLLTGMWALSRRSGSGSWSRDYGWSFRLIDLVGIPIGVVSQLVVVRLIYVGLELVWPATFSRAKVEDNARDLYSQAHGAWLIVLIVIVVAGAPIVEELVYRGLLQGAFTRRLADGLAVVLVAALFAVVHFLPVEYPGLFVFGLVLGLCAWRTGRLGMGVLAHAAFNACGLLLVAR